MAAKFITLEGGEGAGKSTQAQRLKAHLEARGQPVLLTREPGGTDGAEAIRALLVSGAANRWDAMTELMLVMAARRDHIARAIRPALAEGRWVICDRFIDSTLAYQGIVQGVDLGLIRLVQAAVTGGLTPDATLLLDIDVTLGLSRARDPGRFEAKGEAFHQALRTAFLQLAAADPQRIRLIPASGAPDEVFDQVRAALGLP